MLCDWLRRRKKHSCSGNGTRSGISPPRKFAQANICSILPTAAGGSPIPFRWGRTSFSGPEGWLPWKPLSGSDLGVSFLLGRQLRWRDYLSGSDHNGGVTVLSVPLSLAGPALEDYKKQAEAAGKQLRRSGLCPYCGNQLKNDLLGKTCPYCASH